jgi:branched-subunit amino acid aminotransferase/4-amino-4-deoxychorismate lyase
MIMLWKIGESGSLPLELADMLSLDAITRQLPGGFYSTFRTFAGCSRVIGLQSHLDRLYRPAHRLGIRPALGAHALRKELARLLVSFTATEARIRLVLSSSTSPGDLFVAAEPLVRLPPQIYRDGVRVITSHAHREQPALKTTGFVGESQGERARLLEQSAFEGLMVANGRILEGLTSNFFYVLDGSLGTARSGILNGVTRRQVLRLAAGQGISILYRALQVRLLSQINEAFLTSSSRGIVPIVAIDDRTVGTGGVGGLTRRLMKVYESDIEQRSEPLISP